MRVCSPFLAQHEKTQQIVSGMLLDPKFATPENVDRDSPQGDGQRQNQPAFLQGEEIFSALSDWTTLLQYVNVECSLKPTASWCGCVNL